MNNPTLSNEFYGIYNEFASVGVSECSATLADIMGYYTAKEGGGLDVDILPSLLIYLW
jgi:hypothetical protein